MYFCTMKILAFGTSGSQTSINQQFANFAAHQFDGEVNMLDMNDFEMTLYSIDKEISHGIPDQAYDFIEHIESADFIVISLTDHNGSYPAIFKNTLDWASRVKGNIFSNKPMLLLATSTGKLGAKFVLEAAVSRFPKHEANILGTYSFPSFQVNFENGKIINLELKESFDKVIEQVKQALLQVEK